MYLGRNPAVGTQRTLDSIDSQFNGVLTTFDLRYGGVPTYPTLSASLIVSLGGVLQEPGEAYYVSSDKIVFSQAPNAGLECWILLYSQYGAGVGAAQNGTLGAETLVLTGELHGPANFIIDPAAVGDDTGTVEIKGNLTVQGTTTTINSTTVDLDHISLGDNEIANFGDGNDLRIFHDGSDSYITDLGTGNLHVNTNGSSIRFISDNSTTTGKIADFNRDGSVNLYYDNSLKFQTTNTGITVTGLEQIDAGSVSVISAGTIRNVLTISETGTQSSTGQRILFNNSEQNWEQGAITAIRETSSNNFSLSLSSSSGGTNVEGLRIASDGKIGIGDISSWSFAGVSNKIGVKLSGTTGDGISLYSNQTTANSYVSVGAQYSTSNLNNGSQIRFGVDVNGNTTSMIAFATATGSGNAPTEKVRIANTGNVGIGTNNPANELEVWGTGTVALFSGSGGSGFIGIQDRDDGTLGFIGVDGGSLRFQTSGSSYSDKLVITPAGNVGIGQTSPQNVLDLGSGTLNRGISWGGTNFNYVNIWTEYGTANLHIGTGIRPEGTNTGWVSSYGGASTGRTLIKSDYSAGDISFHTAPASTVANGSAVTVPEKLRITSTGNVGIGTNNPGAKLEVNGTFINSTNVNTTGDPGIAISTGHRLGFNEVNVRSWTVKATNGTLKFASGDQVGVFEFQHISPDGDASRNLGSPTARWANIYSADLQLSNEGSANDVDGTWGAYTIQEGEEALYLINRRSGKKFKFVLEEVN